MKPIHFSCGIILVFSFLFCNSFVYCQIPANKDSGQSERILSAFQADQLQNEFQKRISSYDSIIISSNPIEENLKTGYRNGYFYLTIGLIEPIGLGFGYQMNSNWALGLKLAGYWLAGGMFLPNSGTGIGIRISQRTGWKILNNVNYEYTFFYEASDHSHYSKTLIKGGAFDINIGNEQINKGINFGQ